MSSKQVNNKDNSARIHGSSNNRKTKQKSESRTVYKSVLDNPFDVKWPNVPLNVQNSILARLIELISGVSEYNKCRHSLAVKRRRKEKKQKQKENISTDETKDSSLNMEMDALNENIVSSSTAHDEALGILKQMTVGINAVTKRLETQCLVSRRALSSSGANLNLSQKREGEPQKDEDEPAKALEELTSAQIGVVLVCRSDIDPPLLVSHIPHLVAACNGAPSTIDRRVKLVTLPKGAEDTLSEAFGLRRVAVIALNKEFLKDIQLVSFLSSVPHVRAPWLVGLEGNPRELQSRADTSRVAHRSKGAFEPTHIKQLSTTAPKDMRAARALRAKGRNEAKMKRKGRIGVNKNSIT